MFLQKPIGKFTQRTIVAAIVCTLAASFLLASPLHKVKRVIDGDTIELENGERVRYIGVDTPELSAPDSLGEHARAINETLVGGKSVEIVLDVQERDKYGRLLAYVYVDTLLVNAWLLERGYAKVLTIPPNVRHAERFLGLQQKAREAGVGFWSQERSEQVTENRADTKKREEIVYVTRTGSKYHRGSCRYLRKSQIPMKLSDAVLSFGPCSVCQPPTRGGASSNSNRLYTPAPQYTGRCQAITKKGTQCKRSAKPGSSYCWQHGG